MRRVLAIVVVCGGMTGCGQPVTVPAAIRQPLVQAQGFAEATIRGQIQEAIQRYLSQHDPAAVLERLAVAQSAQNGQQRFYAIVHNATQRYQLDGHRTLTTNRCVIDGKTILRP